MKLEYETPLAELICFRPMEALASQTQDPFQDTMDLFGGGYSIDDPTSTEDTDIGTNPWG